MFNHQSCQDWNDLDIAYGSKIKPDGKGMFSDCSMSILDVKALTPSHEITGFM